ncbi:hypothetical protein CLIM01_14146 [Colletotrichum limetticola]|uniref:Uncharacterized protein n=1 Tax=Colletotrichum limetticola TaxID=1209924 RepID=A0ABQ9P9A9_9PEZI|nr:hypothetical protein CLIM01_14146 [Colletotrichum limetticola]
MQDWIRRSLTAATNKNDNNRAANHCVIGRPSFGSVSRSPLTGWYSSVQNFKAPPTSQPSTAAHQKRSHFSQWLQKHQDTIPQARAHVSQNKQQQLFLSTQSPRRQTAAKHAHPPAHHQKSINHEYAYYLAAKHSRTDSGTRAKVPPTHVSLLSAVTNMDCCSWVYAYCPIPTPKDLKKTQSMRAVHWWPRPTSSTPMKQAMGSFLQPSLPIDSRTWPRNKALRRTRTRFRLED